MNCFKDKLIILATLVLFLFTSCEKFEGDQTIPAYIQIDSFNLVNNTLIEEGPLTENISDVWVYVDDQIIGAFELPALVPVLVEGNHKLTLIPGIEYNGMASTRGPYKFLEPHIQDLNFVIDSITSRIPTTEYSTNSNFEWLEDFEDGTISLLTLPQSDTSLQILNHNPPHQKYGTKSAVGYLSGENKLLLVSTLDEDDPFGGFELPTSGSAVFLEIEYNTNNSIVVGLIIRTSGAEIKTHPIIVLFSTEGNWNKTYVNLTPTVSNNSNADYFYVFVRSDKEVSVDEAVIKLDNFKLIY